MKIKTLSVQVGDIICFEVPKRGGAPIRGGATIRGNTVLGNVGSDYWLCMGCRAAPRPPLPCFPYRWYPKCQMKQCLETIARSAENGTSKVHLACVSCSPSQSQPNSVEMRMSTVRRVCQLPALGSVSYTNKQYSCWLLLACGKAFYCCARTVQ